MAEQNENETEVLQEEAITGQERTLTYKKGSVFHRMLAHYLVSLDCLNQWEELDFIEDLEEEHKSAKGITKKVNQFFNSTIGLLIAPAVLAWNKRIVRNMEYSSDEEALKQEYKQKVLTDLLQN